MGNGAFRSKTNSDGIRELRAADALAGPPAPVRVFGVICGEISPSSPSGTHSIQLNISWIRSGISRPDIIRIAVKLLAWNFPEQFLNKQALLISVHGSAHFRIDLTL